MNILIVGEFTDRPERALYHNINAAGHKLDIMCNPQDELHKADLPDGMNMLSFQLRSRLDYKAICSIRDKVQSGKPDVIYATSKKTLTHSLLATAQTKTPIVAYRGVMGNVNLSNPEAYFSYSNKRVKKIICVCDAVRDYLYAQGYKKDKVLTVHKGHDASWYEGLASRDAFKELGIPDDAFVMSCVAQMRPRKGIHILLEALSSLPKDSAHVLLVGKITDARVQVCIEKYGLQNNVHCLGFRSDAVALAGGSDLCVMPSLKREGLPKSIIEAMIQGVPAVVTNVGGMPELVEHNKSGLVVPPSDAKAFADALSFFAASPEKCRSFGEAAKQRMKDHFSAEATAEKTIKVFEEALNC